MAIWDDLLPPDERGRYEGDFAKRAQGGKNPALLIVDIRLAFAYEGDKSVADQIADNVGYWGDWVWGSLEGVARLMNLSRGAGIPVFFSEMRKEGLAVGGLLDRGSDPSEWRQGFDHQNPKQRIIHDLQPLPDEVIIRKTLPSAFFGTTLSTHLFRAGIDTLVVTGCVTSACVRATVTDAYSHGFKVLLVEECVWDRRPTCHKMNLFDMNDKLADVVTLESALAYLESAAGAAGKGGRR